MGSYEICDFCGNLAEKTKYHMCHRCREGYLHIRSIIEENPNATVLEISNRTGLTIKKIHTFVNKGYFSIKEGSMGAKDL